MSESKTQRWIRQGAAAAIAAVALGAACPAPAEWAVDFLGGMNVTEKSGDNGQATVGGRAGYYFQLPLPADLGLFVDGSVAEADPRFGEMQTVQITLLPLLRFPLMRSEERPGGRLQPYLGAGPSAVRNHARVETIRQTEWDFGLDARGGLALPVHENFSLLAEYRFTYSDPDFGDVVLRGSPLRVNPAKGRHHGLLGIGLRF